MSRSLPHPSFLLAIAIAWCRVLLVNISHLWQLSNVKLICVLLAVNCPVAVVCLTAHRWTFRRDKSELCLNLLTICNEGIHSRAPNWRKCLCHLHVITAIVFLQTFVSSHFLPAFCFFLFSFSLSLYIFFRCLSLFSIMCDAAHPDTLWALLLERRRCRKHKWERYEERESVCVYERKGGTWKWD